MGPGAHLAASTLKVWRESYARFLGSSRSTIRSFSSVHLRERIDRDIVSEYVAWRKRSCGDMSIAIDLDHLRGALKLLCPDADWSWLLIIIKRIAATAPRKAGKYHLVTSDRLYALGVELMDRAVADADAAGRIRKACAFQYRDGLVIALLALIPLRRRTLTALRNRRTCS